MNDQEHKSLAAMIVDAVKGNQTVAIILILAVVILLIAAMVYQQNLDWVPSVLNGG